MSAFLSGVRPSVWTGQCLWLSMRANLSLVFLSMAIGDVFVCVCLSVFMNVFLTLDAQVVPEKPSEEA